MKTLTSIIILAILLSAEAIHHIPVHKSKKHHKQIEKADDIDTHIENLINNRNTELYGNVTIGNPPQEFAIIFDTGSSNFWVPNSNCKGLGNRKFFTEAASETFVPLEGQISIQYGKGAVTGDLGQDEVNVAGMQVKNVTFARLNKLSGVGKNTNFDGLIGMAFPEIAEGQVPTFFHFLLEQKLIDDPSFSFFMSENSSAIILGGIDPKYAKSEFKYFPIIGDGYWSIYADTVRVGKEILESPYGGWIAMVDSGTSRIIVPPPIYDEVIRTTGLDSQDVYDMEVLEMLPTISLEVEGELIPIPPSSYMMCEFGYCFLGLQGVAQLPAPNYIILGDLFLKSHYTHFDYGKMRVGFAKPAHV